MKNKAITNQKNIVNKEQNGFIFNLALPCDRGFHWIEGLSILFFVYNNNKKAYEKK